MTFYLRNLPHWQPGGAIYFITFILAGSLPKKALEKILQQKSTIKQLSKERLSPDQVNKNKRIF